MKSNTASNGRHERTSKTKKNDSTSLKQTETSQKINDQILDPDLKEKVLQLMEIANCTQDNAFFALHDTDNDVSTAAMLLLERNNDMQDGWKEQKAKSKKKHSAAPPASTEPEQTTTTETEGEVWKESNNRERSYPRNAPPRLQRTRGSKPEGRYGGPSERRYGGGDRGRPRGRGGSSRDGFNRSSEGGFGRNRGSDNHTTEQTDMGNAPQIGTWTSEADANPKTDSWGDVWNEDDNQWQGDLKSTHVFESTAKTDTFPTPTEFDPTAVAALPTAVPPSTQSSSVNGNSQQTTTATSLGIDPLFPKQAVETMNPPSISMYDNQLASDSIKSAIGMPTQQQLADEAAKNKALGHGQQSGSVQVANNSIAASQSDHSVQPLIGSAQPQRQNKQQRSKVPPPSTKIPTAPVEMPHSQTSPMTQLGVQFGAMDFTSDSSLLNIESSSGYNSVPITSTLQQHIGQQQTLPSSLYTSGGISHNTSQSTVGPEPIAYPSSSAQQSSSSQSLPSQQNRTPSMQHTATSGMYHSSNLKDNQGSHPSYTNTSNMGSQYKSGQSSHSVSNSQSNHSAPTDPHSANQSFQSSQTSGSGAYYQLQNLQDKRGGYQSGTQSSIAQANHPVSSHANQYTNSLYSSSGDQLSASSSYSHHYNAGVSPATSLPGSSSASVTSHIAPVISSQSMPITGSGNRSVAGKQPPPNLPPPGVAVTAAAPLMPSYIMGAAGTMPYYNHQGYYTTPTNIEDLQKYQQQAMASSQGYYDVNSMNQFMPNSTTFPGTATAGAGDGKMARLDAQSPTVQGSQSTGNQSQQAAPTNTQSHQQQFVSLPPGYHSYAYYPGTAVMPPGYTFQMPSVTQGMNMTGSNPAVYSNQKGVGSSANYYPAINNVYDDNLQSAHSNSDYSKSSYGGNKQQVNNLGVGGSSNADVSAMYKSNSHSQSGAAAVAASMYGGQGTASQYMSHPPQGHVITNQHLIQSQMAPIAQESGVGSRGAQSVSMPKGHKYYSGGSWGS